MVFKNSYILVGLAGFYQRAFDFCTGYISGVENTAFVVAAFASKIEFVFLAGFAHFAAGGKMHTAFDQIINCRRTGFHDGTHHIFPAESGTGNQSIFNVFIECIQRVCNTGDPALGVGRAAFIDIAFGQQCNRAAGFCKFECRHQACQRVHHGHGHREAGRPRPGPLLQLRDHRGPLPR